MAYDRYPAVDGNNDFPPEVRAALAKSLDLRNTVIPMTQTERNNLTAPELWDGRLILNTTEDRINRYDALNAYWTTIVEEDNAILYFTEAERDNLTGAALWDNRLILNTTTKRINRYDLATASWVLIVEPSDLPLVLTSTQVPLSSSTSAEIGTSDEASRADHRHPAAGAAQDFVFTASGTFTKPAGAARLEIMCIGGGGGAGYYYGGAGGDSVFRTMDASAVTATVTVTVGAGGTGGTPANYTGSDGGDSSFGSYVVAKGGRKWVYNTRGGDTRGQGNYFGGGAGRGTNTGTPIQEDLTNSTYGGGGGGGTSGVNNNDGGTSQFAGAGGAGVIGGNGQNGFAPGGGGGGTSLYNSGNGGSGARGEVRVRVYF